MKTLNRKKNTMKATVKAYDANLNLISTKIDFEFELAPTVENAIARVGDDARSQKKLLTALNRVISASARADAQNAAIPGALNVKVVNRFVKAFRLAGLFADITDLEKQEAAIRQSMAMNPMLMTQLNELSAAADDDEDDNDSAE